MLRLTPSRLLLDRLGSTKLGQEVLAQTRNDMKHIEQKDNFIVRFLTRRRPIDFLAIEVDGPITRELDPSFVYAKHAVTAVLCLPVFALTLLGMLQPTYYLLVSTRIVTREKYEQMWKFSSRWMELLGQAAFCLVLYDFSAYIRYPLFARVLAPLYRRMGWLRAQPVANFTAEQLKSGAARRSLGSAPRPLGRPLGEVRREWKGEARPNPFGSTASASRAARPTGPIHSTPK